MNELEELLLRRIEDRGPMPFAAYMSLALYHPRHGYYSAGPERSGWRGHFLTSPELDPAFGQLWARGFEQVWELCGRPERFEVVEVGPGEGAFAAAVLAAAAGDFGAALSYRLVERIPSLQERQRERLHGHDVTWSASITEVPAIADGCIFANEVLDNLPVHLVERQGGRVMEVCVTNDGGRLATALLPPSSHHLHDFLQRLDVDLPEGHRFEVGLAAESFVSRAAGALGRGALVFVDYGAIAGDLAARRRGTLVCYSSAGVDEEALEAPGTKDITSHVNWTAVIDSCRAAGLDVTGPAPQRDVLLALGLRDLEAALKRQHHHALAAGDGAGAVRTLSRRQSLGILTDPGGLGRLDTLVALSGIRPPSFVRSDDR